MNLFDQLLAANAPPAPEEPRVPGARNIKKLSRGGKVYMQANIERINKTEARYKEVMGDGWMATSVIERKLGCGKCTVAPYLNGKLTEGLVERRPRDNEQEFNRKKGWEWKWK